MLALHLPLPFNEVTAGHLHEFKNFVFSCMDIAYNYILSSSDNRKYENTVVPLIKAEIFIEPYVQIIDHIMNLHPEEDFREIATEVQKQIEEKMVEYDMGKDIYMAFKDYYIGYYQIEKSRLNNEEIRYFERLMINYRRNGLDLDDTEIEEIKLIKQRISTLGIQFTKNINDVDTQFSFTRDQLNGIPQSWFEEAEVIEEGENHGDDLFDVTLKYPDYYPIIEYVKDEQVRKTVYMAFNSRCLKENTPILKEIMNLRSHLAHKLGYKTYADYSTEIKMIKTSTNALNFLNELNRLCDPLYKKEYTDLLEFAHKYEPNPLKKDHLDRWDINYYNRAYKEKICNLDMQEIRQYFPLEVVRNGLFNIYQHLLGLQFNLIENNTNKWHESVQLFSVKDQSTNQLMGYFYMDMYPREGKYGHAAAFPLVNRARSYGIEHLPIVSIVCNFPENQCLEFEDVVTLFHEFGHAMHMICSQANLSVHGGLDTEVDFVECPSQMLEFWCYCEESLSLMSKHILTGQTLSADLIDKLKKYKNILQGYYTKRQITMGLFDLTCHMLPINVEYDSKLMWDSIEKDLGFETTEYMHFYASFDHIISEYDAGYYGYLLSESYATHLFYKKFKYGHVLDQNIGLEYRKKLLEPGSTIDGYDLLINFLGEEPQNIYFLIEKGIQIN